MDLKKSPCLEGVWIEQNRGLTISILGTRFPSLEYEILKGTSLLLEYP
jgi:hypothetical protein